MKPKPATVLLAEVRESFLMAVSAIVAHKLRSALTLLGVLVGVFSIIVAMTAMRVMQNDIEKHLSRLGSQTFMVRKWPGIYFGGPDGFEKFWRRKNITLGQAEQLREKATLPLAIGVESAFWGGQIETRYKKTAPTVQLFGESPGSFPARNWSLHMRGASSAPMRWSSGMLTLAMPKASAPSVLRPPPKNSVGSILPLAARSVAYITGTTT